MAMPDGHEVERHGDRGRRAQRAARRCPARPSQFSRALPPRETPTANMGVRGSTRCADAREHRAYFLVIAGVIGARLQVGLAAAAAEMRDDAAPPARRERACIRMRA